MSIEPECKPLPMSQKMSQNLLRIAYVCLWLLKRKPAAIPGKVARPEGFEPPTFGFEVCLKNLLGYGEIPVFRGKCLVFL
jgi:hypothetical protein